MLLLDGRSITSSHFLLVMPLNFPGLLKLLSLSLSHSSELEATFCSFTLRSHATCDFYIIKSHGLTIQRSPYLSQLNLWAAILTHLSQPPNGSSHRSHFPDLQACRSCPTTSSRPDSTGASQGRSLFWVPKLGGLSPLSPEGRLRSVANAAFSASNRGFGWRRRGAGCEFPSCW